MIRKILSLAFITLALISCEDVQDNDPALQAEVDGRFFKAIETRSTRFDGGAFLIQGVSLDETLNLNIRNGISGTYRLAPGSRNFATFENEAGNVYTTDIPGGGGEVEVTGFNTTTEDISGTFRMVAILPGIDTLFIEKGFFYKSSYGMGSLIDEEPDENLQAGTFVASIDGVTYNPFTIEAASSGNSIIVVGSTTSRAITISVPNDVNQGSYALPEDGFMASYELNGITQNATVGNITIFEHNTEERTIKGTFAFQTSSNLIEQGQFNITYL